MHFKYLIFVLLVIFLGCHEKHEAYGNIKVTPDRFINQKGYYQIQANVGRFVVRAREEFDLDTCEDGTEMKTQGFNY